MAHRTELHKAIYRIEHLRALVKKYVQDKRVLDPEDIYNLCEGGVSIEVLHCWLHDARIAEKRTADKGI